MYVGIVRITVVIDQSHSLKEKRMVLRRIKDRVRERLGVAINEVGELDRWQRAELGCAVTSGERAKALAILDDVVRVTAGAATSAGGAITEIARDVWTFDAPAAPAAAVDDRTGSGDKAAGAAGDAWVPDAWKDQLDGEPDP
jgi:uncharacterized protein YlxP (DUF503 family)